VKPALRAPIVAGALLIALAALGGCSPLASLSAASAPLDAYALTPLQAEARSTGSRHIVVELPTASGAIVTDRILVKPAPLQVAFLPDARWVDPAPELVQTLLVQSLQASGAFRLVGRQTLGLLPDYTLLTEIRDFQAETLPPDGVASHRIRVGLVLTLVRESDRSVVATRSFDAAADVGNAGALTIVTAFDAAMAAVLAEAVAWVGGITRGGGV
jgi:cholesterol transport system auxiliary component